MTLELIIIGLGKRVTECALPAIAAAGKEAQVRAVFARSARTETVGGESIDVRALDSLASDDLSGNPTVYLCVPKTAIPHALQHLARLNPEGADLLIDTPVMRLRDFRHADLLKNWHKVSVAEDCARMPWIELLLASEKGSMGRLKEVVFEHSAYAYHGVATGRALARGSEVIDARQRKANSGRVRSLNFMNGFECEIVDPRDYSSGRILARYEKGLVTDRLSSGEDAQEIDIDLDEDGQIRALSLGEIHVTLDEAESRLTAGDPAGTTLIARQAAMKRVGFLRLLRELARGKAGYALDDGLEDMVVDHLLERLGRYRASHFTSPRHKPARMIYKLASRLARS